jgi:tRNA nucleotidyltransferase (CCA-adding enzyme)
MIVDPFGGQDALRAGVVDCVGDPSERFGEDALRMLRAIRFASEFEFSLLPDVWEGIIRHRPKLQNVAMERVSAEWDKMMSGSGPEQANHYLFKSGLLAHTKEALPESVKLTAERYRLNGLSWEWDKWGHATSDEASLGNLLQLPMLPDPDLRWAALLTGAGINEEDGAELFRSLRFSGKRSDRITGIVGINEMLSAYDENSLRTGWVYAVLDYGRASAEDWCSINEMLDEPIAGARNWLTEMPIVSVSELNVRGDELARSLDKPPGPWIATMLEELLEEVAFGSIPNDKESLLFAAKHGLESKGDVE